MTRLPIDSWNIQPLKGPEWPDYRVASICALQGCSSLNISVHHITRRSFMSGAYSWVRFPDGTAVGNLMPLCWRHHNEITDNKARITWNGYKFEWQSDYGTGETIQLAQPPTIEAVREGQAELGPVVDECPTCHQKIRPKYEHSHEPKRPRKTWTVTVPNDAREVGAEVLDTLLESARLILDDHGLSYGQDRGVRYFILSTSLGLFVAHAEEIL